MGYYKWGIWILGASYSLNEIKTFRWLGYTKNLIVWFHIITFVENSLSSFDGSFQIRLGLSRVHCLRRLLIHESGQIFYAVFYLCSIFDQLF